MITYLIVVVVIFVSILIICKWMNFSIIPEGLKLRAPKKFKFPKIRRNGYAWEADAPLSDESESSDDEDDVYSSDEEYEYSRDGGYNPLGQRNYYLPEGMEEQGEYFSTEDGEYDSPNEYDGYKYRDNEGYEVEEDDVDEDDYY